MLSIRSLRVAALGALCVAATASAVTVPFTETFSSSAANWSSSSSFTPLTYFASGGADGLGYASVNYSFVNNLPGDQPLVFRGQSNFGSSGNAFVGDWISTHVTDFSFYVRHNATAPVTFFARFAPEARQILDEVLEKYAEHGVTQLTDPKILQVPPLSGHGNALEIAGRFGGPALLRTALEDLQILLYAA